MATAARARAEPRAFDFAWTAPETCPGEDDVRGGIERHVGRSLASSREPIAVRAVVTRERSERWRMDIATTVRHETRERVIEGDSCRELADAAALVVAFLVPPPAEPGPEPSAPEAPPAATASPLAVSLPPAPPMPETSPPATTEPARDVAPATPVSSPVGRVRAWTFRATAGADSSSLPSWTGFVGAGVGRAFGRASVELSGAYYAPRTREIDTGRGGRFELFTLAGRSCYAFFGSTFEWSPCLGAEYGTVRGSAFGVDDPEVGKGLWLAATMASTARWRITPWLGTMAEAQIAVPLVRPDYVIDNVGAVYRTDFVGLRLLAGLESYF
jgi:hypothetical protein